MTKVQVQSSGSELRITLPEEIVKTLGIHAGDELFISNAESGAWISPYDPRLLKVLRSTEKVLAEYEHTLRELAK
ncbi:AbrB/MazE/SpoVT family DNA-binding domain-containing protein [bacterium]|nr:AbrB/MazE/SpoVT family DNA-binding domain-containing protein [bacterium]